DDGAPIRRLIEECQPLDPNSTYAYLLLSHHFAGTCVLAERAGQLLGFISAYVEPRQPDTLFVWQVAVDAAARGQGLALSMLRELMLRDELRERIFFVEATVTPGNEPSRRLFDKLAQGLGAPYHESDFIGDSLFAGEAHEEERLVRIGPIPINHNGGTNS
ncbi:MAG: diaminobutyrate acetyltransferase, partial [Burkholderiales bacterium]